MPGDVPPEGHRQRIGCMAGVFQILNRRHMVSQAARVNHYESSLSSSSPSSRSLQNDSVFREKRVVTVKEAEAEGKALKLIDSPRPNRKALDGSGRFSLDESEFRCYSSARLKEVPRFSLDSRFGNGNAALSTKRSNVVIKLMGLETLPDTYVRNGDGGDLVNNKAHSLSLSRASTTESPREEKATRSSSSEDVKKMISMKEKTRKKQSTENEFSRNQRKKPSGKPRITSEKSEEQLSPVSVLEPLSPNSEKFEWSSGKSNKDQIGNPRLEDLGKLSERERIENRLGEKTDVEERDMMEDWRIGDEEASEIVVELERWIFRDLIRNEILQ